MELPPMPSWPFQVECLVCRNVVVFLVDPEGFKKWCQGMHAQDALPENTPEEREMLISRTCGPCFDNMFPDDDEYLEED